MWFVLALLSAIFAALTSILAKVGIEGVNSNLATAIRTVVVVVMAWGMVFLTNSQNGIAEISKRSWLFIILSGLATGASWLCYYRALQLPVGGGLDCDIYEGEYNIVPSDTVQVLPTANKLLKHDIVIEANSGGLPEGSEMATDDDIDSLIDDVFGTGVNPDPDEPTYSPDDIATEKELNDAITDVFG